MKKNHFWVEGDNKIWTYLLLATILVHTPLTVNVPQFEFHFRYLKKSISRSLIISLALKFLLIIHIFFISLVRDRLHFQYRNCIIIVVVAIVTSQKWGKGARTLTLLSNNNSHTANSCSPVTLHYIARARYSVSVYVAVVVFISVLTLDLLILLYAIYVNV